MFEGKFLCTNRDNLNDKSKYKALEDITISDFRWDGKDLESSPIRKIAMADFVLFVDNDGREKIFKSRLGKDSIIF